MKKLMFFLTFIAAAIAIAIFLTACNNIDDDYLNGSNNNNQHAPGTIPDKPIYGTVVEQLAWIQEFGASGGYYIVRAHLPNEIISATQYIRYRNRQNITVRIVGQGQGRTLSLGGRIGPMFIVEQPESNVTLILENITLVGYINNRNCSLIYVDVGALEMRTGAVITGNTHFSTNLIGASAGGVTINRGNFIMRGNARIHGNHGWWAGGVILGRNSTLTMLENARIDNNHSKSPGGGIAADSSYIFMYDNALIHGNTAVASGITGGGGVAISQSTLNMRSDNARISGNRVYFFPDIWGWIAHGGGVNVANGTLYISGGTIYGSNAPLGLANEMIGGGIYTAMYRTAFNGTARVVSYNGAGSFIPESVNRPATNNTISVSGNGAVVNWGE